MSYFPPTGGAQRPERKLGASTKLGYVPAKSTIFTDHTNQMGSGALKPTMMMDSRVPREPLGHRTQKIQAQSPLISPTPCVADQPAPTNVNYNNNNNVDLAVEQVHGSFSNTTASSSASTCDFVVSSAPPGSQFQGQRGASACEREPEYDAEIRDHFLVRERTHQRDGTYLDWQPHISERMRIILIDWLVDVTIRFKLHPETFYLAVDVVDRYLAQKQVTRTVLQLVGITSVLLAAKHEEIWPPEVKDCVFISANTYSTEEVINMERDIACALRFTFTVPTVYPLLSQFLDASGDNQIVRDASMFYLELAAMSYDMLRYLPSRVAAASLLLGRLLISFNNLTDKYSPLTARVLWDADMCYMTRGITVEEVVPIAEQLLQFAAVQAGPAAKQDAVKRKYSSSRLSSVATLTFPSRVPQSTVYVDSSLAADRNSY